jgi:hypothetical protein
MPKRKGKKVEAAGLPEGAPPEAAPVALAEAAAAPAPAIDPKAQYRVHLARTVERNGAFLTPGGRVIVKGSVLTDIIGAVKDYAAV